MSPEDGQVLGMVGLHRGRLLGQAEPARQADEPCQPALTCDSGQEGDGRALREAADDDPIGRDPGVDLVGDELGDGPDRGQHAGLVLVRAGANQGAGQAANVEPAGGRIVG